MNNFTNEMFKLMNGPAVAFTTTLAKNADEFENFIKNELTGSIGVTFKRFKVDEMPLEELPTEIQEKVKSTLKAFDRCGVTYENGEFLASTGCCIRSEYNYDHFVCGEYFAKDVYTLEERKQNFIEEFGYCPAYMK